ncbi:hypothetical protein BpHYR1_019310, partial [Brachionus plicatilis]
CLWFHVHRTFTAYKTTNAKKNVQQKHLKQVLRKALMQFYSETALYSYFHTKMLELIFED